MSNRIPRSVAVPDELTEQDLGAGTLGLLAQPDLWPALRLTPVGKVSAERAPWTIYWATRLDAGLEVLEARTRLATACTAFGQRGERSGQLLCVAAIIEGFYVDEGPLDALDEWIALLQAIVPAEGQWASVDLEARIMACGVGVLLRQPTLPLLAQWAERGGALVRQIRPGPSRMKLATFLAQYHLWRGELGRVGLIVDALPGLSCDGLLPAEAVIWHETVAIHARAAAQYARGQEAVTAALKLVRQYGLQQHHYALRAYGAALALAAQDARLAASHLDAMRLVLDRSPQADQTHYWHFHAGLALLKGDSTRAQELAQTALANSLEIGGPYRTAIHALSLGQILLHRGDAAAAKPHLQQALATAQAIDARLLVFTAQLMLAACWLRLDTQPQALELLRQALADGASRDFRATAGWWLPEVMRELAHAALAHEVEPTYVCQLVRLHRLPGADPALASWPWPLKLRGFGHFEAWVEDQPLVHSQGKTAQRPLDLLRALLAHGQAPLSVNTLMQWLWPEAEPEAQRKAFDVALLRLRRQLNDARLLQLEGGFLSLDAGFVWSDVAALQVLLHRIGSAHGATLAQLQGWAAQLLALVRGPFLGGKEDGWAHAARQRYQQRFVVTVTQLAAQIEALDRPAAIRLYQRALDLEPLAESLARRLMRLHAEGGEQAEALRVWRALRTMLMVSAGLAPARETQELATRLGLTQAVGNR